MKNNHIILIIILSTTFPLLLCACAKPAAIPATTSNSTSIGEVEAKEFMGQELTPIGAQKNNALAGTQYIDKTTYTLTVDGLVDHPLSLSYADLQAYPKYLNSWI